MKRHLIVAGPLGAVTTLVRTPSIITWEPPFSLNLTDIEPDIIYCIEVFLTDCGIEYFILRDCSVTTNYYDTERFVPGYTYKVTVTPRSNVVNALPGIPLEFEGKTSVEKSISRALKFLLIIRSRGVCVISQFSGNCHLRYPNHSRFHLHPL